MNNPRTCSRQPGITRRHAPPAAHPGPAVRRGFTLVEILSVIAIIGILSAAVLVLAPSVMESQNRAATRGYIDSLSSACESFRNANAFRQYPTQEGEATDDEQWRLSLYACLSGLRVLRAEENKLRLAHYTEVNDESGKTLQRRTFVSEASLRVNRINNAIAEESQRYFVDAWDNPIAYRYNVIAGGEMGSVWENPKYLLISAGAKYHEPLTTSDCFTDSMETRGQIPGDDYFYEPYRADNIVSWKRD